MPDSQKGGNKIGPPQEKLSMEMRLLLALLLTVPIIFLGPYFLGNEKPEPGQKKAAAEQSEKAKQSGQPSNPAAHTDATAPAAQASATAPAAGPGTPQRTLPDVVIDTDLYHVVFTNQGGTVSSWQLKKYHGNDGKLLDLVNSTGYVRPFSVDIPSDQALAHRVNWSYFTAAPDSDKLGVVYEYTDGRAAVKKTFRFEKNSYMLHVTSSLTIDGREAPQGLAWRCGFGDLTIASPASNINAIYYDNNASGFLGLYQGSLVEKPAQKETVSASGPQLFAGVNDNYFAAVFLPSNDAAMHNTIYTDFAPTPSEKKSNSGFAGIAVSDGATNDFRLFVGPKDYDLLRRIDPRLEQLINFGYMAILAKPLFLVTNWANDNIVHNFGWSIVIVTVVLNLVLFPLRLSSMKSMRKMQAIKPQIDAINAKYKGMSVRDPRKADQTQETMDLYKKYGINPAGGCVPMLLQFPILIAFYQVFRKSVEMRGAEWLWVTDLSQPDAVAFLGGIHILPIIMIATQFLSQKMMPQPGADPAQQRMTMFMPLIFGFMFYNFQSGLVLYYLTSNLVGVGLQWFYNRTDTARLAAESVMPPPKKKTGKK
jgi:YidC/Oxa1 family membrane protein insertase